jgi:hypothetical protein
MIIVALLPLAGMFAVATTVWKCYWLTRELNHVPRALIFPAISALGVLEPEHRIYQIGFAITGVCVFGIFVLFRIYVVPALLIGREEDLVATASVFKAATMGYVCSAGIVIQGWFTLSQTPNTAVMLHFVGALMFMFGAMQHCNLVNELMSDSADPAKLDQHVFQLPELQWSLRAKKAVLSLPALLFLLPLLAQFLNVSNTSNVAAAQADHIQHGSPTLVELEAMSTKDILGQLEALGLSQRAASLTEKRELVSLLHNQLEKKARVAAHTTSASVTPTPGPSPIAGMTGTPGENAMGLMQWLLIGMFILYFGTYTVDFYILASQPS